MKSYTLRVEGAKTVLQLSDEPRPEPGPGQVLLKMHAAALNRGEKEYCSDRSMKLV